MMITSTYSLLLKSIKEKKITLTCFIFVPFSLNLTGISVINIKICTVKLFTHFKHILKWIDVTIVEC